MSRQLFEYHPVIAYRFIPGLKTRVLHENGGYLVRVNNCGFRCNHDIETKHKTPGVRRILLFGDSFTAGDGVSNEKRYGDLLEKKIPNLEVYNFGLPGSGTDQQYLTYREFAIDIEHDVLVIAVLVENIRRVTARYRYYHNEQGDQVCYAKPYFELLGDRLVLRNVPPAVEPVQEEDLSDEENEAIDRVGRYPRLRNWLIKTRTERLAHKIIRFQPYDHYNHSEHPAWVLMRAILEEWIRGHKGPVVLMPIPVYYYVEEMSDPSPYQARFRELASETGCTLHDPLSDLMQYPLEERRSFRFEKDVHPSPKGHWALATSLAPVLEKVLNGKIETNG